MTFFSFSNQSDFENINVINVLNTIPAAIFIKDSKSHFIFINTTCERQWGLLLAQLKGNDGRQFFPENQMVTFRAKDREVFEGKQEIEYEEEIWNAELKQNRIGRTIKQPIYDQDGRPLYLACITIDITEKKRAETDVRSIKEKLQGLYDLSPIGIALTDMNGKYLEFNHSFQRICGYTREELNQLAYWDLTPREYESQELIQLELLQRSGTYGPYEKEYLRKDGTRIPLRLTGVAISGANEEKYIWSIVEDITEQISNQKKLKEARDLAERSAKMKSEFLANMSHEIRTPMNGIIGLTNLALDKAMSRELRNYLTKIKTSSQGLLIILNDILDFSKIEAGQMSIENTVFHLEILIMNLKHIYSDMALHKNIKLNFNIDKDIPNNLIGDPLRLQQILSNLISNSLKFTEKGEVIVNTFKNHVSSNFISIGYEVYDTGIGISDEDQKKLFQAFEQIDGSITRRYGGTGLGLAISNQLLHLMNSEFQVTSKIEKGTTFKFFISHEISKENIKTQDLNIKSGGELSEKLKLAGREIVGSRVLVVEDNDINTLVINKFLKITGIQFKNARNGIEALKILSESCFDAILMDLHMPEMSGTEATIEIRKNPSISKLPIIALTAGVTVEEREACFQAGMDDYMTKPVDAEKLIQTLCLWIKKSKYDSSNL